VGPHVGRLAVGQRSDLIATESRAEGVDGTGVAHSTFRFVVLSLLTVDGVLSAVGGALFLPSYIGAVPFPISALISGLLNASLVWAAQRCAGPGRLAALPLFSWLLTVLAMCLPGPGGDVIFAGRGVLAYSPLLLLALGLLPSWWVLWGRRAVRR
jgi:hypothetical protein